MSNDVNPNLDTIIAQAVEAKISAAVIQALSGDEVLGRYVTAALQQPVEINDGSYNKKKVPFLDHVIRTAMRKAVNAAVVELLEGEVENIKTQVAKQLRASSNTIAEQFVAQLADKTIKNAYGLSVTLKFPNE